LETIKHYNITIRGRVQGVGYRYFALKTAHSTGIKGYVKNNQDGTVFIEAEGEEIKLNQFVAQCKTGPGWAFVDKVEVNEFPVRGYEDFKIKH
jgi:acylphosphatase